MLAVSPLRIDCKNEREEAAGGCFSMEGGGVHDGEFPDFTNGDLLDTIDFDDLFMGINDGDLLPDLEMDPEILAEFSSSVENNKMDDDGNYSNDIDSRKYDDEKGVTAASVSASEGGSGSSSLIQGEEIVSKREEPPKPKRGDSNSKGRKTSSAQSKNPPGKRKVKVDWTPELHRRFVQAVEQLGVDKAVPSRILELMGNDCLTRHNIASHLQKYRSHRKHLLAREAEAASWSQRRQMYGTAAAVGGVAPGKRGGVNPWIAPTMGFPPAAPMPHLIRPLHVWGHPPSVDQSYMQMWPKHLAPAPSPPHAWPPAHPPPPPSADPSFWHSHHQYVPNPPMPYFASHTPQTRFPTPPVPGIPPPAAIPGVGVPTVPAGQTLPRPPSDVHPSKESIDAAIGDVLTKPWLPLPLGLKPPSIDSVVVELHRQGVSKIPPTNSA